MATWFGPDGPTPVCLGPASRPYALVFSKFARNVTAQLGPHREVAQAAAANAALWSEGCSWREKPGAEGGAVSRCVAREREPRELRA